MANGYKDKLQQTLSLVGKLNERMIAEMEEEEQISLHIHSDGSGSLVECPGLRTVFEFENVAELTEFLEAGPLKQIKMLRVSMKRE